MKKANLHDFRNLISRYNSFSLDSMIFSYYFHGQIPYVGLSELLIDNLLDGKVQISTSIISYLETLSYPDLENKLDKISFIKNFFLNQVNLQVIDLNSDLADLASSLRRSYKLSVPDSVQYSVCLDTDVEVFVTNDEHFRKMASKEKVRIVFLNDFVN